MPQGVVAVLINVKKWYRKGPNFCVIYPVKRIEFSTFSAERRVAKAA